MTDARTYPKGVWAKLAVMLLLLVQFLTFSGFTDVAPSRDSRTQSEWVASFPVRWKKTVSFRGAVHKPVLLYEKEKAPFKYRICRQNNRYLTWLATVCAVYTDEPLAHLPVATRPRCATDEDPS